MPRMLKFLCCYVLVSLLTGCGYNAMQAGDEQVKAAWSEVLNQYQRRADLIPNLVETVKGFASQEQETLTAVVEARARATSIQVDANTLDDPQKMQQFQQAQNQMTGALSRLMAVSERYPERKSNQNFLALQSQLEGTENRISVARRDYNEAVREYNTTIRTFPAVIGAKMIYGAKPMVPFEATTPGAQEAPKVNFN
ncbi:MAG: LemA family protein [Starkeya sp.]|nr:LemA family protein [Starkeya sp.]